MDMCASRGKTIGVLGVTLLAASIGITAASPGRWVVDVVQGGDAKSEQEHDYAGDGATVGVVDGRPFRQAAGWLRYTTTAR
jgi:hypothetical protein